MFLTLPTEVIRISSPSESPLGHLSSPQNRLCGEVFSPTPLPMRTVPAGIRVESKAMFLRSRGSGKSLNGGAFSGTRARYAVRSLIHNRQF